MDNFGKIGENEKQNLQVWCCDRCRDVHFKAGNVLLNFSQKEFADLTYAVNEIFQQVFGSLEFYHLISLLGQDEDVLMSNSIS